MNEDTNYGPVRLIDATGADMPWGSIKVRLCNRCGTYVDVDVTKAHDAFHEQVGA